MKKIKLKWTLSEANSFAMVFSRILTKEVSELREEPSLCLCAIVLLGFQKTLTDKILTAKMLFKQDVQVSLRVEQAVAIYTLVMEGHLQWIVKTDTYEEVIMTNLFNVIHQKFIV
jgi:hypothetical protein